MVVIKKLGILSAGKMVAILSALFVFIFGIIGIVVFVFTPKGALPPEMNLPVTSMIETGLMDVVLFTVFGFISGVLVAVFYNLFAKWIGGINIELEGEVPAKKILKK